MIALAPKIRNRFTVDGKQPTDMEIRQETDSNCDNCVFSFNLIAFSFSAENKLL